MRFHTGAAMNKSIMIVDDSASIRDLITLTLEPEGFEVVQAEHGEEGLAKLNARAFDLVITDLNMPIMDGFGFLRRARRTANGAGIPIVTLTIETRPESKAESKAAGATGWLNKPFDGPKLIAIVKRLLD